MGKACMHPLNNLHTALSQSPRPWDSTKHAVRDDTRTEAKDQTGVPSSPPLLHAHEPRHTSLHKSCSEITSACVRIWIALEITRLQGARTAVRTDVCGRSHNRDRRWCPPFTSIHGSRPHRARSTQYAALMHPVCKNTMFPHSTTTDIRTHSLTHSLTHCLVQLISTRTCFPHSTTTNIRTHSLPACFH